METVQHETGHMIHFNIGLFPRDALEREAGMPRWLVEGTTMLFEVPPSEGEASLGALNDSRLFELRKVHGFHPLDAARWKAFVMDDRYWFGAGGWSEPDSYHLGWGLVYYLWKEKREGLAKYMQRVFGREEALDRTATEKEFVECFGELDETWHKAFCAFLDKLQVRPSHVNPVNEEEAQAQNLERQARRIGRANPNVDSPRGGGGGRQRPPGGR